MTSPRILQQKNLVYKNRTDFSCFYYLPIIWISKCFIVFQHFHFPVNSNKKKKKKKISKPNHLADCVTDHIEQIHWNFQVKKTKSVHSTQKLGFHFGFFLAYFRWLWWLLTKQEVLDCLISSMMQKIGRILLFLSYHYFRSHSLPSKASDGTIMMSSVFSSWSLITGKLKN